MRIGILADTHDKTERTRRAVGELTRQGARALFHCGDVTGPEVVEACATLPAYFARGNNDLEETTLRRALKKIGAVDLGAGGLVELAGHRLAMTHGHDRKQVRALLAREPEYLFVGHSHRKGDRQDGRTRVINPGALHRVRTYTVAILELDTGELRFLAVAG